MLPASPQHSSVYFSNVQDSQMNRKLWGIALLGTWKGFPSAKAACCVNGRNYKGIRREHASAADGKGQSSTGKCSGVDSVGTGGSSLGWVQGSLGHAELERGEPKPLAVHSSLSAFRSPCQGRSDQPLQLLHQKPMRDQWL